MKPAVLHVIKTLELGGAETNLRNLMEAFDPEKFEHHIAYSFGGELEAFFKNKPSVKLYRFSGRKHRMGGPYSLAIILKLWRYILRHRIRIVHTHNFNAHFWAVYAARLAGAKVVEHVHDFRYFDPRELERRKGDANLNRYIRLFKGLSDRVVILTEQNREFLVKNGFYPREKVALIPNGIPLPETPPPVKGGGAPTVLVASRMAPTKNIELVLEVAPRVLRDVPDAVFLIAGNGELLEDFKERAAEKGLGPGVRFLGFRPDVAHLLAESDVFLLPSYLELHSISILEALSLGIPVVASSNVGCNSDVLTSGTDAFLHDPFSGQGWAETLVRLLKDPALRGRIGRAGQELCRRRFDIRQTARSFEALYAELAGRHG